MKARASGRNSARLHAGARAPAEGPHQTYGSCVWSAWVATAAVRGRRNVTKAAGRSGASLTPLPAGKELQRWWGAASGGEAVVVVSPRMAASCSRLAEESSSKQRQRRTGNKRQPKVFVSLLCYLHPHSAVSSPPQPFFSSLSLSCNSPLSSSLIGCSRGGAPSRGRSLPLRGCATPKVSATPSSFFCRPPGV